MNQPVQAIPDRYTSAIPYLTITGADRAIEFYKKAFGATEIMRMNDPAGQIMHAELRIGDVIIMLHEENPNWQALSPTSIGNSPVSVMFYTTHVDDIMNQAAAAGATITMPAQNMFYGDRCGNLVDPFGHKWMVATHIEEVSSEELAKRAAAMFAEQC
ncbi:VOC family protein [Chitinivorax sp. B]|uniref:VOC family protein n=1 Tax=Chitinivorax sp. B TaxID=2502235 RepID=UPI0010F6D123|nr:VOC family protein [Chitinivorax sp. B]